MEHEDDCLLLDNSAAASLLSPTLWFGGGRTRVRRRVALAKDGAEPPQQHPQQETGPGEQEGSPDLEYMDDAAELETLEQLREDMQRLAALEELYTKLKVQNTMLEQQLMGVYSAVNRVLEENRGMKRLISLLHMRRADFVDESQDQPQQQQQQQQEGLQGPAGAAGEPQQQRHPEPQAAQLNRRFLEGVGRRLIGNLHQLGPQDQHNLPQQAQQPAAMVGVEGTAAPSTPSAKTMPAALDSPKIAAYRGPQHPALWSPGDLPEEAQIAAAVLATTGGDPAAALNTLLDHAIAARQGPASH
ncbi:hypothetical protein N2152v2_004971 [Parachlorella kessleri]